MKHSRLIPYAGLLILPAATLLSSCADTPPGSGREAESWTGRLSKQEGISQPGVATNGTTMDISSGTGAGTDP